MKHLDYITPKRVLDGKVAEALGLPLKTVSSVTQAFLHEVGEELVTKSAVRLNGLGDLFVEERMNKSAAPQVLGRRTKEHGYVGSRVVDVGPKRYVHLRKSVRLRERFQETYGKAKVKEVREMEKLGVDEGIDQEQLEKQSAQGCPVCGKKPERLGSLLVCPDHGSEPFEQKK